VRQTHRDRSRGVSTRDCCRNRIDTVSPEQRDAAAEAARKFGLEPRMIEIKAEQGYGGAFGAMDDARGQPIILPAGPTFLRDRAAIAQALLERRIPSIAAFRETWRPAR
jgi:hypothetical protein